MPFNPDVLALFRLAYPSMAGTEIECDVAHCSHALCLTIKHFFPSFWGLTDLRYLALLMTGGYGETD